MGQIIKLGNARNPENHIKIEDNSVSFSHIELEWVDDATLVIKDLDNTNPTKVNNIQIRKKTIVATDEIKIGRNLFSGQELIDMTLPYRYFDRVAFYEEFAALEEVFNAYRKQEKKLKSNYKTKVAYVRFGIPAVLVFLFLSFGKQLGLDSSDRIMVSMVSGGVAAIFADKLFSADDLKDKLYLLKEEYNKKIKCPKCQKELIGRPYKAWKLLRRCPNPKCQANWIK